MKNRAIAVEEPELHHCAECGQPYTPFPVRESRLCAPCVYRAVTRWADVAHRRQLLETAMRVDERGVEPLLRDLGRSLESLAAVRRAAVWTCEGNRVVAVYRSPGAAGPPAVATLAVLDGPVFVRELAGRPPEITREFRGWAVVAPLRAGARLLGALGVSERRGMRLARLGDLELLSTVAAAAAAALERHRLLREIARLGEAVARLEGLESMGALAAGTSHEIENTLLTVRSLLDASGEDAAARLRALGLRHLRQALDLSESIRGMAVPAAVVPATLARIRDATMSARPLPRVPSESAVERGASSAI